MRNMYFVERSDKMIDYIISKKNNSLKDFTTFGLKALVPGVSSNFICIFI